MPAMRRKKSMKELVRTGNIVRLSFLQSLLADADIRCVVLDANAGAVIIGAIVPRLMVDDADLSRARWLLDRAGESVSD
jgi:hypothetical protein